MSNVPPIPNVPPSPEVVEYGANEVASLASVGTGPGKTYDAVCEVPRCGWVSYRWDSQAKADARLAEHYAEHETGNPAPELIESEAHNA